MLYFQFLIKASFAGGGGGGGGNTTQAGPPPCTDTLHKYWHRMLLRVKSVTEAIQWVHHSTPASLPLSTLEIDSRSQHSMCEHYVWLCFHLHWSIWAGIHLSALLTTRWVPVAWCATSGLRHILLQSAADRQRNTNISPMQCFTSTAISLLTPTPYCQWALCLTWENVKALLYSAGPPLLLLYGQ